VDPARTPEQPLLDIQNADDGGSTDGDHSGPSQVGSLQDMGRRSSSLDVSPKDQTDAPLSQQIASGSSGADGTERDKSSPQRRTEEGDHGEAVWKKKKTDNGDDDERPGPSGTRDNRTYFTFIIHKDNLREGWKAAIATRGKASPCFLSFDHDQRSTFAMQI